MNVTSTQSASSTSEDHYVAAIMVGVLVMTILVFCLCMWMYLYYFRRDLLLEFQEKKEKAVSYHYQDENDELDAVYGGNSALHVKHSQVVTCGGEPTAAYSGYDDTNVPADGLEIEILTTESPGRSGAVPESRILRAVSNRNSNDSSNGNLEFALPPDETIGASMISSANINSASNISPESLTNGVEVSRHLEVAESNKVESIGVSPNLAINAEPNSSLSVSVVGATESSDLQGLNPNPNLVINAEPNSSLSVSVVGATESSDLQGLKSESEAVEIAVISSAAEEFGEEMTKVKMKLKKWKPL